MFFIALLAPLTAPTPTLITPSAAKPPALAGAAVGAAFGEFKKTFGKSYASAREEALRFERFAASLRTIAEINQRGEGWTAGVNTFADLSWDEFQSAVLMRPQNCSATHAAGGHQKRLRAPPSIDWRDYHALNAVKNQQSCGSCWTFSTSGCLESHVFLKTGRMTNISEQQLVDCAGAFNNHGCDGGLPSQAYEYIHSAGGIDSESAYPYTAKTGADCLYKAAAVVAKVRAVVNISQYDEDELREAVGSVGPVSIAFEVADDFRFYAGGVYDGVCRTGSETVNHAVVAVGYGATADGNPYWTVRNSWSASWGEAGYFRIARGVNKCGLADCASYPIVA